MVDSGSLLFRNLLPVLANERSDKSAALAVKVPRHVRARTGIRVGQRHSWHGVRSFSQGRIEGHFIAAKMILIADAARLDRSELAGPQHGCSVLFGVYHQLHLRGNHLRQVLQELTTHVLRKMHQGGLLLWGSLIVHQQHSLRGIGALIGIAYRPIGPNGRCNRQSFERNPVLAFTANMPPQNGFITDEVHLAIGKTLASINIGAS